MFDRPHLGVGIESSVRVIILPRPTGPQLDPLLESGRGNTWLSVSLGRKALPKCGGSYGLQGLARGGVSAEEATADKKAEQSARLEVDQ